jgi:hypothetical protein
MGDIAYVTADFGKCLMFRSKMLPRLAVAVISIDVYRYAVEVLLYKY